MNDDKAIAPPCELGPFLPSNPESLKGKPTRLAIVSSGSGYEIIGVASGSRVAVFKEQREKAA